MHVLNVSAFIFPSDFFFIFFNLAHAYKYSGTKELHKHIYNISMLFKQNINALKSILDLHMDLNNVMPVNGPVFASAVAHL